MSLRRLSRRNTPPTAQQLWLKRIAAAEEERHMEQEPKQHPPNADTPNADVQQEKPTWEEIRKRHTQNLGEIEESHRRQSSFEAKTEALREARLALMRRISIGTEHNEELLHEHLRATRSAYDTKGRQDIRGYGKRRHASASSFNQLHSKSLLRGSASQAEGDRVARATSERRGRRLSKDANLPSHSRRRFSGDSSARATGGSSVRRSTVEDREQDGERSATRERPGRIGWVLGYRSRDRVMRLDTAFV